MITDSSFCGIGCEECLVSQGEIKTAVNSLIEVLKESGLFYNLKDLSGKVPAFKHEQEFYSFLNELMRIFGSCEGCKSKNGFAICNVRTCASLKNLDTCFECKDKHLCKKILDKPWLF